MQQYRSRLGSIFLATILVTAGAAASCGGGSSTGLTASGSGASGGTGQGGTGGIGGAGGDLTVVGSVGSGQMQGLDVQPAEPQVITVAYGQPAPTVNFNATLDGMPIDAGWSVDRGELATITSGAASTATITPKGKSGGLVTVTAGLNGMTVKRQVLIKLTAEHNGTDPNNPAEQAQTATTVPDLTKGGGIGGVGGEGLGVAVDDAVTLGELDKPSGDANAKGLRFLYPYDKTVWPRGLLAPLLQWDSGVGSADAIKIELETTSGSFSWKGKFGRPAILAQSNVPFVRHPIPQGVWDMATNSAGGTTLDGANDKLTVKLTVAKGGVAYGPITQTWMVAPGRLSGTIYYNSYGTNLAKNHTGAVGGDGKFGGAVLSIHVGDTGPKLVAGENGGDAQCRVCHSVAANGSRLIVQRGDNNYQSALYTLSPDGATQQNLKNSGEFPGITPDGEVALLSTGKLVSLANGGELLPTNGLNNIASNIGTPAFSPDGKHVVFNPMNSVGADVKNPTQSLMMMDFDQASGTFSNPVTIFSNGGQDYQTRPGWPAFFPDGKSVVFQQQTKAGSDGNDHGDLYTRKGSMGYIALASTTAGEASTPLHQLNGQDAAGNSYLPKLNEGMVMTCTADGVSVGSLSADHGDDVSVNYEPTVNPVASGGYAWVVFTSRRMYGSVAKIPPFCSDPRGVDLINNITTKKLWVAAINLNAKPGEDASHPAFYLPAQELLAGNARGFWVLDPCKADGLGCETGDQCCNGFCSPSADGNSLVCANAPPEGSCSKPQEKCTTAADCCDPANICINGFCALKSPN